MPGIGQASAEGSRPLPTNRVHGCFVGNGLDRSLGCRKRCAHPLAPSVRGLRPQAVGERTVRLPEIFRVQTVKKMYFCLVACVGATIGRPPAYRSNAFSGIVSCKANGHGRAMLAPTRVSRQSEPPIYEQYPQGRPHPALRATFPRGGRLFFY